MLKQKQDCAMCTWENLLKCTNFNENLDTTQKVQKGRLSVQGKRIVRPFGYCCCLYSLDNRIDCEAYIVIRRVKTTHCTPTSLLIYRDEQNYLRYTNACRTCIT